MIKLPLALISSLINPIGFIVSIGQGSTSGSFLSAALVKDKYGLYHIKIIDMYSCVIITSTLLQLGNLNAFNIYFDIPNGVLLTNQSYKRFISFEKLIETFLLEYKHKDYIKELFKHYIQESNVYYVMKRSHRYTNKIVERLKLRLEIINEKIKLLESNYPT